MTAPDEAANLYRAPVATVEASAAAQLPSRGLVLPKLSATTKTRLLHLAVLLALPLVLLLINDSWSSGWVTTPQGADWVAAGTRQEPPPPGWLVNYTMESLDTPVAWVDPFIYQSFFQDLKGTLKLHDAVYGLRLYYHSRLPWLLLGSAVYSIAPAGTANVLLHLLLFYAATFSLYATVRLVTKNDLAALTTALLLGVNSYFLWSVGWNYVDGFCVALTLVMLALLTKAAVSPAWRTPLILAGVAAAMAVSANIFLTVVMPGALVWYVLINTRSRSHNLVASIALMIAGGVAGIAALCLANLALTGDALYFMPQIWWITAEVVPSTRDLYPEAGWLVMPGAAAVISFVFVLLAASRSLRKQSPGDTEALGLAAAATFLLVAGVFAFLQFFTRSNVLEHAFYVSYLLPFAYLAIGMAAHLLLAKWDASARQQQVFVAGLVLCMLAPFVIAPLRFMPGCPDGCLSSGPLQLLVGVAFALVAVALVTRSARAGLALLVVFSLVNVGVADQRVLTFSSTERDAMHQQAAMVNDTQTLIKENNADNAMRFWVDLADPYGWVYAAVAGENLWDKRLVSLEFPKVRPDMQPKPGDRLMLATSGGVEIVAQANEALKPFAVHLEVFQRSRIQRGGGGFDVIQAKVMPGAASGE